MIPPIRAEYATRQPARNAPQFPAPPQNALSDVIDGCDIADACDQGEHDAGDYLCELFTVASTLRI